MNSLYATVEISPEYRREDTHSTGYANDNNSTFGKEETIGATSVLPDPLNPFINITGFSNDEDFFKDLPTAFCLLPEKILKGFILFVECFDIDYILFT